MHEAAVKGASYGFLVIQVLIFSLYRFFPSGSLRENMTQAQGEWSYGAAKLFSA
jgi:hypothetical protein